MRHMLRFLSQLYVPELHLSKSTGGCNLLWDCIVDHNMFGGLQLGANQEQFCRVMDLPGWEKTWA